MRVLGVDPGLTRCGLGVVEAGSGRSVRLVQVRVVGSPSAMPLEQRLEVIYAGIVEIIAATAPDAMAVERMFSNNNKGTVMGTAQASGVALLAGRQAGLAVGLHTPSEVKAAVTGTGGAGKEQVADMVRRILGLDAPPRPADATDSLALAICHLWNGRFAALGQAPGGPHTRQTAAQRAWAQAEATARTRRR